MSEQLRRASDGKRDEVMEELVELVSKHLNIRQACRELHLEGLRPELDKLRGSTENRKEARDQIIGKHVPELLGEDGKDVR